MYHSWHDLHKTPNHWEIQQTHHSTQILNAIATLTHNESCLTAPCEFPRRQLPPAPPTELPFPATEENSKKLQEYLLEYYKSSSFNTCEHQTLPMMDGPPLKLMVDPGAVPVSYHTPVPVPLHWQDRYHLCTSQIGLTQITAMCPMKLQNKFEYKIFIVPRSASVSLCHTSGWTIPFSSENLHIFFCICHNFFPLSSVQIIIIPACCLLCVL